MILDPFTYSFLRFGKQWPKANLQATIRKIAGPYPERRINKSTGKTIYINPKTKAEVVVDYKGQYFRVWSGKGRVLDKNGNIPAVRRKVKSGKIKDVELNRKDPDYQKLTHYRFD